MDQEELKNILVEEYGDHQRYEVSTFGDKVRIRRAVGRPTTLDVEVEGDTVAVTGGNAMEPVDRSCSATKEAVLEAVRPAVKHNL